MKDDNTPLTFFSPACPIPRVWSNVERIQILKDCLNPESKHFFPVPGMHMNIRACIAAYENNERPERGVAYFKNGNMVKEAEGKVRDTYVWKEVRILPPPPPPPPTNQKINKNILKSLTNLFVRKL